MVECEVEEEDDWVVVKKQKITILVSPPSPSHPQSTSSEMDKTQPMIARRSSGVGKRREREEIGKSSKDEEPICNPVAFPGQLKQPSLIKDGGNRKVPRRPPPIGALNVVNRRMRARNLERKLEGMGGLRWWLVSQGLERFVKVFEREKVGKYELVNLTMSLLKDMGADAVGPRRKLIHAIDCLTHPYYLNPAP